MADILSLCLPRFHAIEPIVEQVINRDYLLTIHVCDGNRKTETVS